jgi:hypothetical protein
MFALHHGSALHFKKKVTSFVGRKSKKDHERSNEM